MPQIRRLKCVVASASRDYVFEAELHQSERPDEQRIDREFYEKWAGNVHRGVHHELLLVASPAWERVDPEVAIHVYTRKDTGERFVCYAPRVETAEHAGDLFRWWCVGMIFSLEHKKDFATVLEEHSEDFLEFMDREYEIRIVE